MTETFTLVVYQLIPEEVKYYLVPNSDEALVADCLKVNDRFIGGVNTTDAECDLIEAVMLNFAASVELPLLNTHITQVVTFGYFL